MNPMLDGDGHFVEPVSLWHDYVPSRMRDRIRVEYAGEHASRLVFGDYAIDLFDPGNPFGFGDSVVPGGMKPGQTLNRPFEHAEPGGWDAGRRLAFHDADGVVGAVLFPTIGLHFGSITDADSASTACRAVNDWAADYATAAPGELKMVATLPGHFPELAARELRRAVERHGFVAAHVRPNPTVDGRRLDHPSFAPLWETAQDLGVPVTLHNVAWTDRPQLGLDRSANFIVTHAMVHPFEAMSAFSTLYQGGVFDRYPELRFGFMEAGCGWAPFWVERLHEHVEALGWLVDPPWLTDPLEIFRDRCFVGCEGEERMVPYVQQWFGDESVVWSSDFPHFDVEPPFGKEILANPDFSDSGRDGVLRRAAIALYGIDWEAMVAANARRRALVGGLAR
jgi:predicted TIM-barrel fold metal-dependent hydrolase